MTIPKRKPRVSKEQAEIAILHRFAEAYSRHYGAQLDGLTHRDKPDFSAVDSITHQTLGIEVTGVYQDEREAEVNYWLEGEWGILAGNLDALLSSMNQALINKAEKSASYEKIGPFILAIWIGSFVFHHASDVKGIEPRLHIPDNPFSLIALVVTDDRGQVPELHVLQETPSWRREVSA
jgi:hypothetical protein